MTIREQVSNKDTENEIGLTHDKIMLSLQKEELYSKRQDREERKRFANKIFALLVGFLVIVFAVLFFCGFQSVPFALFDIAIVTLLGTSSANVIGIFVFVVRYLFNSTSDRTYKFSGYSM
ncbi:hypothetical protein Barb7_00214 [Bacteroidales bacterium Barb7]|nr:hypothetical protein Barb7_00214 [Bacteroidales bacterium Barb7]